MKAYLQIEFEDGTSKRIELVNAIETDHGGLQSVEFRETKGGKWILYFTKRTFEGRKVKRIGFEKGEK